MENEEQFIYEQIIGARQALMEFKKKEAELKSEKHRLENFLDDCEQAAVDYMAGNGCLATEYFTLGNSYSVDIADDAAVPESYSITKTVTAPDKRKILGERPTGNWYTVKHSQFVKLKEGK